MLSAHHSADKNQLKKVKAMEKVSNDPWRCRPCRRLNKGSAAFCGACGSPWERCWDRSYVHNNTRNYTENKGSGSSWQQWEMDWQQGWDQRPKSPRRRSSNSPRSTRKGDGKKGKPGKQTSHPSQKWPTPVLDYSKIKDGRQDNKKLEVTPPRMTVARPVESSPEVQELLISLQENYPDGLPAEVQAKVDHLKKTTTTDLKKHIGQLTKVKKDLDSMREARIKHMQAWKQHVTNLVENTKAQLQQYQQVMADFENCESELVAMFDNSRRAILQITQQTTPAEEDMKAIKEVDSGLLAGGAEMPIEVDGEEPSPGPGRTEVDADDMNRLQESFMECIAAAAEGKRGERPRSRSRRRGETEEGKETIRKDL